VLRPVTRPSVVVLFQYDGSAEDARIADGIAIEITRLLAQIDGLDVRAAVPVSRYRERRPDPRVFGDERRAGLVLDGLVLSDEGGVRHIHASLFSMSRSVVLWSKSFIPENNDILAVNDAIAAATANALGLRVRSDQRRYVLNPSLQPLFLRARALQGERRNVSRPEAVDLFEQVTRESPSFAPAFAALATTLNGNLSTAGWARLDSRAAAAARAAYDADPHLAEANVAMGLLAARACQWPHADEYFAHALTLDPSATSASIDYAISTLLPSGRSADAITLLRSALIADATSLDVTRTLAYAQLQNGDYESALETSRWVIEHDPHLEAAYQSYGRARYLSGQLEEALQWFGNEEGQWGHRGYVLARMGRRDEAKAVADSHPAEPARQMLIYAGLADVERAVDALERTARGDAWRALVWMGWPEIAPVLGRDPRAATMRNQLLRACPVHAGEVFNGP
jgi:TolB-like protein